MRKRVFFLWVVADVFMALLMFVWFSDLMVSAACEQCFDRIEDLPQKKLALVLGTAKYRVEGGINPFYAHRLEAAAALFHSGKIDFLLVSGDNAKRSYDEPTTIKNDLVKLGVSPERIFLDYAGFRTLDSMVRCKEVFGETDIIVVSQQFHNERAIFIARHFGIEAVGYNAADVDQTYGFKTAVREKLARAKVILDLFVLNTQPRFLGPAIEIKEATDSEEMTTEGDSL
jgi:SanA protein